MLRIPVIAFFVFTCCYNTTQAQVTIQGNIKPHPEWQNKVYLFYFPIYDKISDGTPNFIIDSARVRTDGGFTFGPKDYKRGIYRLSIPPMDKSNAWFITQGANSNYLNLVVTQPAENIRITGQADSLHLSFRFPSPSPDNALIQDGVDAFKQVYHNFNTLIAETEEVARLADTATAMEFYTKKQPEFFKEVLSTCDSIRALAAKSSHVLGALTILRYAHMGYYLPNAAYWDEQLVRFEKLDPNNPYLNQIRNELDEERGILSIGSKAPEIALPSPKGDFLKLSEVKKRLTIIDFWASWCGPCIMESKTTIKPLHEKWADKGLEVYAVSIDKNDDLWKKAMEKNGYGRWFNVRDADAESEGGVYALYNFTAVPTIFLVDDNMNIVAKNLRGSMLTDFVENYLKE
jgi:thiol-disulfide isomerase/thioredoxin